METVTLQGPVVVIPAQEYETIMNRLSQLEQSVQALTQLLENRDDIKAMRETEAAYFTGDAVSFTDVLAEEMDAQTFEQEMRLLAAIKLFELGRLTSGRAAELARLSRVEFLLGLKRYQVFPLAAELEELEIANA